VFDGGGFSRDKYTGSVICQSIKQNGGKLMRYRYMGNPTVPVPLDLRQPLALALILHPSLRSVCRPIFNYK